MNSEALNRINSAALRLTSRAQAMLGFYMLMEKREVDSMSTVMRLSCEGGNAVLEYNPQRIMALTESMLSAVIYMECLRLALNHCTERKKDPVDIYKISSDMIVAEHAKAIIDRTEEDNADIIDRYFPTFNKYRDVFDKYDFQYGRDFYLEKVFNILAEDDEEKRTGDDGEPNEDESQSENGENGENGENAQDNAQPDENSTDEQEQGDADDSDEDGTETGDDQDDGSPEDAGDRGDGSGDDKGVDGSERDPGGESGGDSDYETADGEDGTGEGCDDAGSDHDAGNEYGSGAGDGDSNGSGNGSSAPSQEEVMREYFESTEAVDGWNGDQSLERNVENTAREERYDGGFDEMASGVVNQILEANHISKVNCKSLFKQWLGSNMDTEYVDTRRRRNRRYGWIYPGHRHNVRPTVLLAMDVSGSMHSYTEMCIEFIRSVSQECDIDVAFWDAKCSDPSRSTRCTNKYEYSGGGGTRPECVMEHMNELRKNYTGIIYVTDCIFNWPMPVYARKVFIVRTDDGWDFPAWCSSHALISELMNTMKHS